MSLEANRGKQKDLIPKNATWIQDKVQKFEPAKNSVKLRGGDEITYDYMVIAMGVQLRYDMIKGAKEALDTPGVCSNYSPFYVEKHYKEAMNFKGGNALYTFPNTPIKCAGAPQKACYITDSILRQRGVRDQAHMIYATSLKRLFGIESYLKSLEKVARDKEIDVRTRRNLIEVNTNDRIATFELLDEEAKPTGKTEQIEYSLLHIGPPCSTPEALRNSAFVDKTGFMDVDGGSLQSKKYPNVFGVGDCMNTPNAKTAAAVSSHLKTIEKNLTQVMQGNRPCMQYDGYASCPLVVSTNRVILAEFGPRGAMETTPFDQSKPTYWAYLMKRYFMPALYWNGLIKGYWNGPATLRNCTRLVKSK
ncbi:Sulfide:quinone oxidoreductase, mitochondrial [Caenorhabditis elegans]|nr:FAD/NAD(P)-binding domain-containing protein [Caenorhabditis elegans]CAZ65484.1 FAD/NAD(P)-binding domain-containing protein [Caenorhabditis elegans]|eukprot:NP_001255800.1 Sulfide Quinone oxidoReDuctase [Caenorhabditis elegans]